MISKKKFFTDNAGDFPAEIANSSGFISRNQVISKKKQKGPHQNCKGFSGRNRKFKRFFRPKTGDLQKKIMSSSQKRHKIWCQSTTNTNLDLDLRSRSSEPVNFFGAQSSLGGDTIFVWGGTSSQLGGTAPVDPPRGAGSGFAVLWRKSKCVWAYLQFVAAVSSTLCPSEMPNHGER